MKDMEAEINAACLFVWSLSVTLSVSVFVSVSDSLK